MDEHRLLLLAKDIEQRGEKTCAARQGHPSDCIAYLGRGMRCPDCPRDHYEEAAEIVREAVRRG